MISLKHGGGSQTGMGSVISYRQHGVYMEPHLTAQDFSIWSSDCPSGHFIVILL